MKSSTNSKKIVNYFRSLADFYYSRKSFSQFGEDLIVAEALSIIGESNVSYLDIGANHPCSLSNTYYFYKRGGAGILIEPDPLLCKSLQRKRPRDTVLNCGVGFAKEPKSAILYRFNSSVLNTFSREEAQNVEKNSEYRIVDEINVDLIPIDILLENYSQILPNFLSIDVEGLDYEILKSLNFRKYRPAIILAETLTFEPRTGGTKITEISDLMLNNGYHIFADTRLNTIFIDNSRLQQL
jgi:FkbM family methyltransferase